MIVTPITPEAFAPFGRVVAVRTEAARGANQGTAVRCDWLVDLENRRPDARLNVATFRCSPKPDLVLRLLERHRWSTQMFLPMSPARYVVVVAWGDERPDLSTARAFEVSGPVGIAYAPGVWHHPMIVLDQAVDFTALMYEDGTDGDCEEQALDTPVALTVG